MKLIAEQIQDAEYIVEEKGDKKEMKMRDLHEMDEKNKMVGISNGCTSKDTRYNKEFIESCIWGTWTP